MLQNNQKQLIVKLLYFFQKVDGEQQCNILSRLRIASKDISIGEELFFDYGDKFKTKWV